MKFIRTLAVLAFAVFSQSVAAQQTLMLSQPALSADHLAYVYAGDIWIADRNGSGPRRLTSHPATETDPSFSPDGTMIAFAADYEDNADVYVVSVAGGQPQRLTWHPGEDRPTGWTGDGSAVTFVSRRETDHGRSGQLYHAALAGGLPEKRMEARVFEGVYDASDERFAYIIFGPAYNGLFGGSAGWKGYRGGTTPAIQIMDMRADSVVTVPGAGATNFNPMWAGDQLYFLSDRDDETYNVFRYDATSGDVVKVSNETIWDVLSAGAHGRNIVYEAGGRLMDLDLDTGQASEIVVRINPDLPQLRSQWKDASRTLQAADISPSGKRVIVTARGEIFTVPVEDGSTRNVSGTGTVREYAGHWSPDGDEIAYIVETIGGQSLVVADQTGMGESRAFELGPYFYDLIEWSASGDGRIAFEDNHLSLYTIDLGSGDIDRIATGTRRDQIEATFSPDGNWLAYTLERPNYHRDLMLLNLSSGAIVEVTDALADVAAPAFSRDGSYLYFAASTNSGPTQAGLDMTSQERPYRAGLYAVVLAADGKSPLLPESGDEEAATDEEDGEEDDEEESATPDTRIDVDRIRQRIVALPVAERNYSDLSVADGGDLYYVQNPQPGLSNEPPGSDGDGGSLWRFDWEDKEASSVLDGVDDFVISADGKKMLIAKSDDSLAVADVGDELEPEALDMSGVRVRVDPREEWAQIFDEAWRMEKEHFYDPGMHGLDWQAVYDRYQPLVQHVGRREDLNALLVRMISEMQVGHNRAGGGDVHRESGTNTGLLGANFEIDDDRYRIRRVYSGETWNPFIDAPLAQPGNEARDGEYVLAVNGQSLTAADNLFDRLQSTVGKQVSLTVGPRADGRDAREIVVEPVDSESMLRLWAWIEDNRRAVDAATDGRVGYVYLPNTAGAGYTFFNRMFFAQIDKEAMIIDERSNGGGQAANYITEVLSRRHLSGWKDRDGQVFNTPAGAMHGPKVMMIDQDAGSGGDYLPYAFRHLGIGKLIGTRTWGGLIGIFANPQLMDGGTVTVPFFRFYDTESNWTVENEGVAPDIEVALDPIATNDGRDTQLERAIQDVLEQLADYESPIPAEAPPYPTDVGQ